jgi:methylenetetrahydrofolate reductase (NADPH)
MTQPSTSKTFSFELFPPKTPQGFEKMQAAVKKLERLAPAFFSVTYGAGGSTRERTYASVAWLRDHGITTAPHLSCIGSDRQEVREILEHYRSQGVERIVALRGDLPSGAGLGSLGEFNYANELVAFIRSEFADLFSIEVAAYPEFHPQAPSAQKDLDNFQRKVDAGADSAITQYFYNADAYFRFLEDCHKRDIRIPIVPGVMPITNFVQLARFSDACGAEIPRWLRKRLEGFGEDLESIRSFGVDVTSALCEQLLAGGAPGLHFYTMNQAGPTLKIWRNLGL